MGQAAEKRIRQYYQGHLPPMTAVPHSVPICDFFFGYDVTKEAEDVLEHGKKVDTLAQTLKEVTKVVESEVSVSP